MSIYSKNNKRLAAQEKILEMEYKNPEEIVTREMVEDDYERLTFEEMEMKAYDKSLI